MNKGKPLVVIAGPTASGKTSLSIKLAKKFDGEIICADSRTIYRGMDIGTAKPTKEERRAVIHWGLDLVNPGDYFTAYDFKNYAYEKILDIRSRNKVPFVVGGTGLYVDSVIFDYNFGAPADIEKRAQLEKMSLKDLHNYCLNNNIKLPENYKNKRYVIRKIETNDEITTRNIKPIDNCIIVGISTDRNVLRDRILYRAEQIFKDNVVEEAIKLGDKYGWDSEAMTGNVYPLVHKYIVGDITLDEVIDKFKTLDYRLAKRQITWLKRNKYIKWLSLDDAEKYITDILTAE